MLVSSYFYGLGRRLRSIHLCWLINPLTVFEKTWYYCLFAHNNVIAYCNSVDCREHQHPNWFPFDLWFPLRSWQTLSSYTPLETEGILASFLPALKPPFKPDGWRSSVLLLLLRGKCKVVLQRGSVREQLFPFEDALPWCRQVVALSCAVSLSWATHQQVIFIVVWVKNVDMLMDHLDSGCRQEVMFFKFLVKNKAVKLSWTNTTNMNKEPVWVQTCSNRQCEL